MDVKIKFIENVLIDKILQRNKSEFGEFDLIDYVLEAPKNLEGFVGGILQLNLKFKSKIKNEIMSKNLIVKIIKPMERTQAQMEWYRDQFENEILVYKEILPYYESILQESAGNFKISDLVPKCYFAEMKKYEELGTSKEFFLVMENLTASNFHLGPKPHLDEQHVLLMIRKIAKYHSISYSLKIKNDTKYKELVKKIIPASYYFRNGEPSFINRHYIVAFERLFNCLDKNPEHYEQNPKFKSDIDMLKSKFYSEPLKLFEAIRLGNGEDDYFVILHGDYYRNNVMFQYESADRFANPKDLKMFDFQDLRYASPVFDLTYFMFINMNEENYLNIWDKLLRFYHSELTENLTQLLQTKANDEKLEKYSNDLFFDHFNKFALYGALVAIYWKPWITCSDDILEELSKSDNTEYYRKNYFAAGGDETDQLIISIAKHASRMGYFDYWYNYENTEFSK